MQTSPLMDVNRNIIVIDDNPEIHKDFDAILSKDTESEDELHSLESELFGSPEKTNKIKFNLDHAMQGQEGYEKVLQAKKNNNPYSLAFVDIRMPPGWDGIKTIEKLWTVAPNLEIVICSAYSDYTWEQMAERLKNLSSFLISKKPFDTVEIVQLATALTEKWQLRKNYESKLIVVKDQLLQSEKLASIGQLAAGVAHEINNPVGFINSNIGTLSDYVDDILRSFKAYQQLDISKSDDFPRILKEANAINEEIDIEYIKDDIINLISESKEGVSRVKKIIQDLKDFARVGEAKFEECNVNNCILSTLNVAHNEVKYVATVKQELGAISKIECIPHQINQVLLNLVINASHAIENKGIIEIKTFEKDNNIFITVEDNGKGMDEATIEKIFDPFFTTKPIGKGTGLGLALSYGIIETHHGKIEVESKVGSGTIFTITLPLNQPKEQANE